MKTLLAVLALCLCVSAVQSTPIAVTIIEERDLFTPGDALITYDPITGLEWLDVSHTLGQTYDQAEAFGALHGFTHGTIEQVAALLLDAGLTGNGALFATFEQLAADPLVQNAINFFRLTSGVPDPLSPDFLARIRPTQNGVFVPFYNGLGVEFIRRSSIFYSLDHQLPDDQWSFGIEVGRRL